MCKSTSFIYCTRYLFLNYYVYAPIYKCRYHDTTGLLDQCRKDYGKVKEVVSTFSSKVETLIDKQRHEYIQVRFNTNFHSLALVEFFLKFPGV